MRTESSGKQYPPLGKQREEDGQLARHGRPIAGNYAPEGQDGRQSGPHGPTEEPEPGPGPLFAFHNEYSVMAKREAVKS